MLLTPPHAVRTKARAKGAVAASSGRFIKKILRERSARIPRLAPVSKASSLIGYAWKHAIGCDGARRSLHEANAVDRREVGADTLPRVALIFGGPERAGGAPERQEIACLVDVEGVAIDEVIGMLLGETAAEDLERLAAVAGARGDDAALHGHAAVVLLGGD